MASGSSKPTVSGWDEALVRALGATSGATPELHLFLEQRQDLRLEIDESSGPVTVRNRLSGLSVGELGQIERLHHIADPSPEDAERLVRLFLDGSCGLPVSGGATDEAEPSWIDSGEPAALLAAAAERVSGAGVSFSARWVEFDQRIRIARPDRPVLADTRRGRRIRLEVRCLRAGSTGGAVGELVFGRGGGPADIQAACRLADQVLERASARIGADAATPGETMVVLGPGIGGIVVHELVGHALEADTAIAGSWIGELEETVAAKNLIVLDDPRRGRAGWKIDDEGESARATPLLQGGRAVGRLHDRSTALQTGDLVTGHGRRASYRDPVQPRMGCTFVAAGQLDPEEVLEGIEEGIFVRRMESASVDPRSGRAIFRVTDADRIVGGCLAEPLRPHLIAVEGHEVLKSIDKIANDLTFDTCIGSCHRDGQTIAVSVGAPTIRIGMVKVIS